MTRVGVPSLSLALLLAAAPPRAAAEEDTTPGRVRFYDFGALAIDGETHRPDVLYSTAKGRATFGRLFTLRRSIRPEIVRSARGAEFSLPVEVR
jgi:hypothetical protein